MLIEVTQEDIDHGVRGECRLCPIARALQRATGNPFATMGAWNCWPENNGTAFQTGGPIPCPDAAYDFIQAFDGKGASKVRPFSFEIPYEKPQ